MKRQSLSNTQFSTLSSRDDFDWVVAMLSIRNATEKIKIGLRASEKFSTRSDIKKRISDGLIRTDDSERKRENKSYGCNLWDLITMCLTPQQRKLIMSI